MNQQVVLQNRDMLRTLRMNIDGAKKDLSAFVTLWKYLQLKQKSQKSINGKVN